MANKFGLDRVLINTQRLKSTLPRLLANQAQTFFANTFKEGGWEGKKWEEPERKKPGTNAYKYPMKKGLQRRTKPTLVKTGILRRGVSMSARVITWDKILLVVDQPYADRHNEGLDGMPKRQFMGHSKRLQRLQIELIDKEIKKIWQV